MLLPCPLPAQQYSFRPYGSAEGLQNLTVLSLAQDGAGYIWAGSEGGLYRYDGSRFRLMTAAEGLPCSTEVHALFQAADGALWVNTCSHVFRFDGSRFRAIPGMDVMLPGGQNFADGETAGQVLIAGLDGLYQAIRSPSGAYTLSRYPLPAALAAQPARSVARYGSELWFGCGRRLCLLDAGRLTIFGPAEGLPEDTWDSVAKTKDGSIWVRSTGRIYRKPPGAALLADAKPDIASSIFWSSIVETHDGSIILPTDNGLTILRAGQWSVVDQSRGLRSAMTSAVLEDREGSLWAGVIGAGVARWLGHGEWEGWTKQQGLPSDLVWSVRRGRNGSIWVGTSLGLARLNANSPPRTWTRKNGLGGDNVRNLSETPDGAIWAVVKPGDLVRIDPQTDRLRHFGPADGLACPSLHRAFVDRLGRLWLATSCGIFRADLPSASARFHRIDAPDPLNHPKNGS